MTDITMKQPDGRWCVFSDTIDGFLIEDATRDEAREFLLEKERNRIDNLLDDVEAGERPEQWDYEKAVERAGRDAL